ncbi:MAG: PA domain-containing protein [Pseudomonadota bacterium]
MNKIGLGLLAGAATLALTSGASAQPAQCANRINDTLRELLECVTVEGVRVHQQAFQDIADANGDVRFSGTEGFDNSVFYVAPLLEAAGYDVTIQSFEYFANVKSGPAILDQTAPAQVEYIENLDFQKFRQSDAGDVTAPVTGVDLALTDPATSTSGCEVADFAGFPSGNIALIQRGTCDFLTKVQNAADAGAVGVIVFNQGDTPDRIGLDGGTLGRENQSGIPALFTTFTLGEELAGIAGLEMRVVVDAVRGPTETFNILAETPGGDPDSVVMVGAHLDSVIEGRARPRGCPPAS